MPLFSEEDRLKIKNEGLDLEELIDSPFFGEDSFHIKLYGDRTGYDVFVKGTQEECSKKELSSKRRFLVIRIRKRLLRKISLENYTLNYALNRMKSMTREHRETRDPRTTEGTAKGLAGTLVLGLTIDSSKKKKLLLSLTLKAFSQNRVKVLCPDGSLFTGSIE